MPTMKAAKSSRTIERGMWSEEEHDKFLVALKVHPKGPWKLIAAQVGTRSARQVQTHAQKYYEKVARRLRGLRKDRKKLVRPEHRLDDDMMKLCQVSESDEGVTETLVLSPARKARSSRTKAASPVSVDLVVVENVAPAKEVAGQFGQPQSFMALLTEQSDLFMSDGNCESVSDSDNLNSLADVDDYYLDFLIHALDDPSDCVSSDESCSE